MKLGLRNMSRLKKKLLLYFILVSVVSVSVSAEIILELGSPTFRGAFIKELTVEAKKHLPEPYATDFIKKDIDKSKLFAVVLDLQVRSILLLLVVGGSIVGSFFLFTKDIVAPMEGMVSATKKIADGDLSASVPIYSKDEIGQIGELINEMSVNLQDMILQIRGETNRMKQRIGDIDKCMTTSVNRAELLQALEQKKIKVSEVKKFILAGDDVTQIVSNMNKDISALQAFVNLYKVFQVSDGSFGSGGETTTTSGETAQTPPI